MKFHYKIKQKIHDGWIFKAVYNHDDTLLATCSSDSSVKILNTKNVSNNEKFKLTHKLLKTIKTHVLGVNDIKFSEMYPIIISCSDDRKIHCYDLVSNKVIRNLFQSYTSVRCFDVQENLIISGDRSNVILYDLRTSKCLENINIGNVVNAVAFNRHNLIIGTNSLFFVDLRKKANAYNLNQCEIRRISVTDDKIHVVSKDRILQIPQKDSFEECNYVEIKSRDLSFSGIIDLKKHTFFSRKNDFFLCDNFNNEFVEDCKSEIKYMGKVDDSINHMCSNKDGSEIILCGENLHFFYKRSNL